MIWASATSAPRTGKEVTQIHRQVIARLPAELPNGPWKVEVHLESGLVKHSLSARIEFPDAGHVGRRGSVVSRMTSGWIVTAAAVGLALLAGLAVLARRSRQSRRPPAARPRERIPAGR
ncbi:hypothetical protein ACIA3K_09255 [Micromonospora sp. NPDC051543]|uniref:hypothetical protein n=1 Tax=Micromonospora sp. NPDC051543 TaxID=3364287 RepID=UPI003787A931